MEPREITAGHGAMLEELERLRGSGEFVQIGHGYEDRELEMAPLALTVVEALDYCNSAAAIATYFKKQISFTLRLLGNSREELELPRFRRNWPPSKRPFDD